jgi:hypothetical protein
VTAHLAPSRQDQFPFGFTDLRVLRRIIAKPQIPGSGPDEADKAERDENAAPGEEAQQSLNQQRRIRGAEVRAHKEDALRGTAFFQRDPV